ncbi:hypothetical protein BX661DRAFT_170561 [Kickxella alabastrina]|uniref:uncharacterized protein n=1 Tax=Kickxella alabastrina TaxID=61397 RepID=UPI00221E4691|nr:uncharacterized protein BX661DRAFT_170561 [Kickxella alabastrina]KAI7829121.1 hypothetical protein BX661DRAFT_170561 [Kickxella alabastrina]
MSDTGDHSDLFVISNTPGDEPENNSTQGPQAGADEPPRTDDEEEHNHEEENDEHEDEQVRNNSPSPSPSPIPSPVKPAKTKAPKQVASAPIVGKKRTRKNTQESKNVSADQESEDINLHVDADWSEDEKEERDLKEPPAKRLAAATESSGPVTVKKVIAKHLENFVIRAVVTRKDVDVIFEHEEGAKEKLEQDTGAQITIIAGKDDPDIVVDRVLVIKGHIANVAAAYKVITEGMLSIKKKAAAATSAANQASSEKEAAKDDETCADAADDDEESASKHGGDAAGDESVTKDAAATDKDNASGSGKPAAEKKRRNGNIDRVTLRMLVPHKCVGSIMGHGGKTINHIRDSSSVSIHTSELTLPQSSERIVAVLGTPVSIEKAISLIAEALTKDMISYNSPDYYVPAAHLPSAMTVETNVRKRKDNKRTGHGHNEQYAANRSHSSNRGNGFRQNSNNNSAANNHANHRQGGGYAQVRQPNYAGGNIKGNASGPGNSFGLNNNPGSSRFNPYGAPSPNRNEKFGRHNDRQSARNRVSGIVSQVNRMPVGANGAPQGHASNQYGSNYRMNSHSNNARPLLTPAMSYNTYVVPPTTTYPNYGPHSAGSNINGGNMGSGNMGGGGGGGMPGGRYGGSGISPVSPAQPLVNAYNNNYNAAPAPAPAPAPYQFVAPVPYGYPSAPAQNMYNSRPAPPAGAYQPRPYNSRGSNRPPMQQQHQLPSQQNQQQHQPHQHQQSQQYHQQSQPQQQPNQQYQQQPQQPLNHHQQNRHFQPPMGMGSTGPVGPVGPVGLTAGGPPPPVAGQTIQQIYVPGDKVGAVIGRRGETIHEIRQSTNARVDIQDSAQGAKERLIVITGGYDQVHSAYYMIKNKIDMARPSLTRP